ncbi:hypothetical protein CVT24_002926 [Panaeolus cyanescens]|uniref:Phosphoinositide phospholipase C n=1 Tax=Panaeolus cyanescens TaxID=181874 RepID=A0A409VP48_9AGAR|nr:hypothetical protein CVT24_002926 [Panaeolus cyanescens]
MQDSPNGHITEPVLEISKKPLRRAENLLQSNGQPIKELDIDDAGDDRPTVRRKSRLGSGSGTTGESSGLGIAGGIGASIKRRLTTLKDRSRAFALGRSNSTNSHPKTPRDDAPRPITRAFTELNSKLVDSALGNGRPGFHRSRHSVGSMSQASSPHSDLGAGVNGRNGRNALSVLLPTMSEHVDHQEEHVSSTERPKLSSRSESTVVPATVSGSADRPHGTEDVAQPSSPTHHQSPSKLAVPPRNLPRRLSSVHIPESLQTGTIMTKVSMKKQKAFLFRLDAALGQIVWESKKHKIIPIENIKEIRSGVDSRYYRAQFQLASDVEDKWLTLIYVLDGRYRTLHLIAQTTEICQMWEKSLRELHSIRLLLMRGLGNAEMREALWVKQYWTGADEEGDQKLSFDEVVKFCRGLGVNSSEEDLERRFLNASQGKRYLDFEDFRRFVKLLKSRPEVERLYKKLISGSTNGAFDYEVFEQFMRDTQMSQLSEKELHAIFDKYSAVPSTSSNSSSGPVVTITGPPSSSNALPQTTSEAHPSSTPTTMAIITLEGFTSFLLSSDNAAYADVQRGIWHDMTRPLCEYFISSSHNTYLVGHQLVGESTIEGYIRALLQGCRSVEVDIYDGDNGPMVFHGKTLTSKVSLREVCHAIIKYGFVASPYPIIISAEVHCSVGQQDMIADIMVEVFGDALVRSISDGPAVGQAVGGSGALDGVSTKKLEGLPSPEELKGKILFKTKNLMLQRIRPSEEGIDQGNGGDQTTDFYSTDLSSTSDSEMARRVGKDKQAGSSLWKERQSGSLSPTPTVVPSGTKTKTKEKAKSEDTGMKRQLSRAKDNFLGKVRGVAKSSTASLPIKIHPHHNNASTVTAPGIMLSQSPPMMSPTQLIQSPVQQSDSTPPSSYIFHSSPPPLSPYASGSGSSDISPTVDSNVNNATPKATSPNLTTTLTTTTTSTYSLQTPTGVAAQTPRPKLKMSPHLLSLLVYTVGVKFRGLNKKEYYAPEHMFSLSENVVNRMMARAPVVYDHDNEHERGRGWGGDVGAGRKEDADATELGVGKDEDGRDAGYSLKVLAASPRTGGGGVAAKGRLEKDKELLGSGGSWDLIKHTRTHLVRIYPKGTRLNSTNYLPNKYWAVGAQLVALNWQTFDLGFTINQAMFLRNGCSGYVLKPAVLRPQVVPTHPPHKENSPTRHLHSKVLNHLNPHIHHNHGPYPLTNKELLATRTWYHLDITVISAQQLPRPKDASGREVAERAIVDPYVEVTVHAPDGPFVAKSGSGGGGLGPLGLKRGRSTSRIRDMSVGRDRSRSRNPHGSSVATFNGHAAPGSSFVVDANGSLDVAARHGELNGLKRSQSHSRGAGAVGVTPNAGVIGGRVVTKHTGVVKRNGFNPVWEEKLRLTFDCVGDMLDLAFVRFVVKQEDGAKHETDEGLAVYCAPVGCLGMG